MKSWDKCVANSIFGMYDVDVWLMYHGCTKDLLHPYPQLNQKEFYSVLQGNLIENNIRLSRNRIRSLKRTERPNNTPIEHDTINPVPELRAKNSRNRDRNGTMTKHCKKGSCRTCFKGRATTICSYCKDNEGLTNYFCDPKSGRLCLKTHV